MTTHISTASFTGYWKVTRQGPTGWDTTLPWHQKIDQVLLPAGTYQLIVRTLDNRTHPQVQFTLPHIHHNVTLEWIVRRFQPEGLLLNPPRLPSDRTASAPGTPSRAPLATKSLEELALMLQGLTRLHDAGQIGDLTFAAGKANLEAEIEHRIATARP